MQNILRIFILFLMSTLCFSQNVYLNEIRANDDGTDDVEFIELIGPAGADISGWSLIHYNGSGGSSIFTFVFPAGAVFPDDGVTDQSGAPVGFLVVRYVNHVVPEADYSWEGSSLQNGPDGIELLNSSGDRIQALTWNGSGDLTGGTPPWRDIGSDPNSDNSLCAPDSVQEIYQRSWAVETATPGSLNDNQVSGDISLPVQLSGFRALPGDGLVTLLWRTASEVDHLGFIIERASASQGPFAQIATYETDESLRGQGNFSGERNYTYVDHTVYNGLVYWYRLIDVDIHGVPTVHDTVSAAPVSGIQQIRPDPEGIYPQSFNLQQNYPNPFNPLTNLGFDLPHLPSGYMHVRLTVYDIVGKKIKTLLDAPLTTGRYEVCWDGRDESGLPVATGHYFYALDSERYRQVRRMLLLR